RLYVHTVRGQASEKSSRCRLVADLHSPTKLLTAFHECFRTGTSPACSCRRARQTKSVLASRCVFDSKRKNRRSTQSQLNDRRRESKPVRFQPKPLPLFAPVPRRRC